MSTPLPPDDATVAAYLGNQLPEAEADAFEIYCLDHPEFARRVELDLCIRHGLREIGNRDRHAWAVFRTPRLWAIAASLGALVVCGLLGLMWAQRHTSLSAYRSISEVPAQLRAGVHFDVTLLRLRGPDATHRVVAPGRNGLLEMKIFPDSPAGQHGYSTAIGLDSKIGPRPIVLNQLHTDANGFLQVYLPLSDVVGHTLKVTVVPEDVGSAMPAPAFRLQVVAATD